MSGVGVETIATRGHRFLAEMRRPVLLLLDQLPRVELPLGFLRPEGGGVTRERGGASVARRVLIGHPV